MLFEYLDRYSNPMLGWLVRIAIETAMRESEIVGLKEYQVNLTKRTVTLPKTKSGEARTVPLSRAATAVFRKALAHAKLNTATDLIFPGGPGRDGVIRPYQFLSCWRILKLRAGISDLRFHDNRHEGISRFIELGLSDQSVASISGHKEMQTIARYRHLRNQKLVKTLDDAETALLPKPKSRQNTHRRRGFRSPRRLKAPLDRAPE
jgi:integrase